MRPPKKIRNFRSETRSEKRRTAHATSCRRTADVAGICRGPAEAGHREPVRIAGISRETSTDRASHQCVPEPNCSRRTPRREARRAGSTRAARYRHYIPLIQRGERRVANMNQNSEETEDTWNCTVTGLCRLPKWRSVMVAFMPPLTDP